MNFETYYESGSVNKVQQIHILQIKFIKLPLGKKIKLSGSLRHHMQQCSLQGCIRPLAPV